MVREVLLQGEKGTRYQRYCENIKGEGHRLLEKGSYGLWHEVIGNRERACHNGEIERSYFFTTSATREESGHSVKQS